MKRLLVLLLVLAASAAAQRNLTSDEKNRRWFSITIPASGSLSEGINVTSCSLVSIEHDTWTAANLTFQVSVDGTNYSDLYDDTVETTIPFLTSAQTLRLSGGDWWSIKYIKFRSGPSSLPVNQAAERTLKVGCK